MLENFIYMELIKHSTWAMDSVDFYHFRDKQKNEVDIVLEKNNGDVFGIEVKASASVNLSDFRGLMKLADFAGNQFVGGFVFYTGHEILSFTQGDIPLHALPIGLFF